MRRLALLSILLAAAPVSGAEPVRLSDAELATVTGKFILPSGAAIAMSVTSDTLVDGQVVLRSTLSVADRASLAVFGASGERRASASGPRATSPMSGPPSGVTVLVDRQSGMRAITPSYAAPAIAVNVRGNGADSAAVQPVPLPLTPGATVQTPAGPVSLSATGNHVTLQGDRIDVTHIMGPAIATAIANTANDRTIDTVTSVDLDLANVSLLMLGGARMSAGDLALDVTRRLTR